jgi:thioredoxin-like negative regulator of GroEL
MEKMIKIESYDELQEKISNEEYLVLYFASIDCSVCKAIKPKFDECMSGMNEVGLYDIELDSMPMLKGEFSVFAAPTVIFLHEGKEIFRESRMININHFMERMDRFLKMSRKI